MSKKGVLLTFAIVSVLVMPSGAWASPSHGEADGGADWLARSWAWVATLLGDDGPREIDRATVDSMAGAEGGSGEEDGSPASDPNG